ncbi:BUD22-domain-containing protein [Russula dissimulans]|nr:BUD22-domain-containing protein [Russula dissimulans]
MRLLFALHVALFQEGDNVKIAGKLFHGLKEVKKAAKKAKAFETQKIVKRLKACGVSLSGKVSDKSTLEAELNALKAIDHDRIGMLALKTSETFLSVATPLSEGMVAKLESRLLSSKTLSKEVNRVILSLHSAFKPNGDEGDDVDEASSSSHDPGIAHPSTTVKRRSSPQVSESNSGDSDDDVNESSDATRSDGPFRPSTSTQHPKSATFDRAGHSPLLSDGASQTLGTDSESIFLPTLSNGFLPAGSDTDWSDGETKVADVTRKNRRGQRARRAIWEKKYGKGAKHLQKQQESGTTHNVRPPWKPVKSPQAKPRYGPRLPGSSKQNPQAEKVQGVSEKNTPHQRKPRVVDDRPLHPSWVAKMRMKERSGAVIVPSQGKRIKFDD